MNHISKAIAIVIVVIAITGATVFFMKSCASIPVDRLQQHLRMSSAQKQKNYKKYILTRWRERLQIKISRKL